MHTVFGAQTPLKENGGRTVVSLHLFLNYFYLLQLNVKLSVITFRNGGTHSEYFCSLPFNGSLPVSTIVSVAGGCSTVLGCLETLLQCKTLQPLSIPPRPVLKHSGNPTTVVPFEISLVK